MDLYVKSEKRAWCRVRKDKIKNEQTNERRCKGREGERK